jgi:SH3 domain protein
MCFKKLIVCLFLLSSSNISFAETKYVTDEFHIMLRSGQSVQHEIIRQLKSGTALTVLQSNPDYTQVRLPSGQQGWVLTRYLMDLPSGRDQLAALQKKYDDLKTNFDAKLEQEKQAMQERIAELEKLAERPLQLSREKEALKIELQQEKDRYQQLARETEVLKSPHKDRQWFMLGAMVAIGSLILGIIVTMLPKGKRKRWNQL